MGFFGKDKEKKEETIEPDNALMECSECGEEYKETELDDDSVCKKCLEEQKMKKEKQSKMNYTFKIQFRADSDGNEQDDLEKTHITKEDAIKCFESAKTALFAGKEYIEFPEMKTLDDDGEDATYAPEIQYIGYVDNISYYLDEDYVEENTE